MTKREIKFRAWDKTKKKWINLNCLTDWGNCEYAGLAAIASSDKSKVFYLELGGSADWEWQQYTGLHDKNGKEIYEGDVVKVKEFNDELGEVWFSPTGMWLWGDKEKEVGECFMKNETYEVVGNIYENPGLLKEAK